MSGARHRRKGDRLEREIVERHTALGIKAERYPLSGASRFRGSGHDVDIYTFGNDAAPMLTEVKGRKNGAGFVTLKKWLGEYDGLFLRRNNADPLVLLPWRIWARLLGRGRS
jgi:Holliday junction resolvase